MKYKIRNVPVECESVSTHDNILSVRGEVKKIFFAVHADPTRSTRYMGVSGDGGVGVVGGGGLRRSGTYKQLRFAELRSCVKVEVAVLGSPSLTVHTVSVDVKQH